MMRGIRKGPMKVTSSIPKRSLADILTGTTRFSKPKPAVKKAMPKKNFKPKNDQKTYGVGWGG